MWVCLTSGSAFTWKPSGTWVSTLGQSLPGGWRHFGLLDIRACLLPGSLAACGFVWHEGQSFTWKSGGMWVRLTLGSAFYLEAWRYLGLFDIRARLFPWRPGSIWVCLTLVSAFHLEHGSICVCLTLGPGFYLEAWQHLGLFDISASLLLGAWQHFPFVWH
jgi:hypothetical protein